MNKFELAKYIAGKYPSSVSPMKLQKLMYYCYAWQLVAKKKFFEATFEAWPHGPVDPEIYDEYKGFGKNPITIADTPQIKETIIDFILDSYSVYSAIELSKTTHEEKPWKMYKSTNEVIPDDTLYNYYSTQAFAKNFPLENSGKYYPPKTSAHYAFTFDMEKEYVPEFSSLKEYLESFDVEHERLSKMLQQYGLKN